ncbi:MAG: helix-turn-helix transcriptional regulator [Acidobacteriaceae bacterium]|nr:helix-turn-helix transcriptional regulator [Acidobacteriaceae bacterium]MBV9308777.1 helix-turn-helix transcriptional regulator [Acidobacteriaceae bacterium]
MSHHPPAAVYKDSIEKSKFRVAEAACLFSRQIDWHAPEHEHWDVQLAIPFLAQRVDAYWHDASGRSRSQRVLRSSCCIIPSGQPHRLHWRGSGEIINIYLAPNYLERLAEELTSTVHPELQPHYTCRDLLLTEIGGLLREEYLRSGGLCSREFESVVDVVALRLLRTHSVTKSRPVAKSLLPAHRLQPALEQLHDCPEDSVRLSTLADACRTSPYHFARSFKAITGSSPLAYQRRLRLEQAKALLRDTSLSIEEIVIRIGFSNPSHFTRLFRQWTGVTPTDYRRELNPPQ